MAVDEAGENVGEVGGGVDPVQLAALDQGREHRPILGTFMAAGEETVLSVQRDGTDDALDRVGVELDAAVVEG